VIFPGAVQFDPRRIAGCGMWLDAWDRSTLSQTSDGTTSVTANDNPVAYWRSKVGAAIVTQTTDANRPLYKTAGISSKPALDFDGSNDVLGYATALALPTVFVVSQIANVAANAGVVAAVSASSAETNNVIWIASSEFRSPIFINPTTYGASGGTASNNVPFIFSSRWTGSAVSGRLNGTGLSGTTTVTGSNTAGVWVGSRNTGTFSLPLSGRVGEVIGYNRTLTPAEVSQVERWLSRKWGVAVA